MARSREDREQDLLDALGIAGEWLRGEEAAEGIEQNAEVARFNRELDLLQLGLHGQHLDFQLRIAQRNEMLAWMDQQVDIQEEAVAGLRADFAGVQRGYAGWLAGSRERVLDLTRGRELEVEDRELHRDWRRTQGRIRTLQAQERQLGVERGAQRRTEAAGLAQARTRVAAAEAQIETIGAARELQGTAARFRREARIEQVGQEIGQAAVSGSARGIRGSFRQTEAMRALRAGVKDLVLFEMEDGVKSLELDARALQAGAERAGALAEQVRIVQGGRVARAGFDVTGAEQRERGDFLRDQRQVEVAQRRAWHGKRGALEEERQRIRRAGSVEQAGYSLRQAEAELGKRRAGMKAEHTHTRAKEFEYERYLGGVAKSINTWTRERLPSLPDYENMATRSALATVLNMASEVFD